jgi:hypothetical protein
MNAIVIDSIDINFDIFLLIFCLMKQKYIFNVFSVDSFLIEYALEEVKMI